MNSIESGRFGVPSQPQALPPLPTAESPFTASLSPDCEKVATVLDKAGNGEATPEDVEYLVDHADDCSPCFQSIEKQRLFVSFLRGNLRQQGVPTALAEIVRQTISREVPAS